MDEIALCVLTAEGPVLERMVESVNLPTSFGSVGVLRGHAPMLCAVEQGILRCRCSAGTLRPAGSASTIGMSVIAPT